MQDKILSAFLERQRDEGMALAASSDLLEVLAPDQGPRDRFIARFRCTGLIRTADGGVTEARHFALGIWFPPDYLARVQPLSLLTWFEPWAVFHPNILPPFLCLGRITPGTPLVDLLYQCFEIITYTKVTMREDDALNKEACAWTRQNLHKLPVDRRPLKRRVLNLQIEPAVTEKPA